MTKAEFLLRAPERVTRQVVNVELKLQWKFQKVKARRNVGHLLR